jgi:hypothetical protein
VAVDIHGPEKYGITLAGVTSVQCLLQGLAGKLCGLLFAVGQANGVPWLPFAVFSGTLLLAGACAVQVRIPVAAGLACDSHDASISVELAQTWQQLPPDKESDQGSLARPSD